ncbi:hypothetical protein V2J09_002007 [Rumex salicifolius]
MICALKKGAQIVYISLLVFSSRYTSIESSFFSQWRAASWRQFEEVELRSGVAPSEEGFEELSEVAGVELCVVLEQQLHRRAAAAVKNTWTKASEKKLWAAAPEKKRWAAWERRRLDERGRDERAYVDQDERGGSVESPYG